MKIIMRFYWYLHFNLILLLTFFFIPVSWAADHQSSENDLWLYERSGFFRFNFDNLSMPNDMADMGLLGLTYFADMTPEIYAGVGGYGSIIGTQGGLFVLGIGGGIHKQLIHNLWVDLGIFAGGGGGRSSLVGGGLMLKPYVGIAYSWQCARLGLHYSYITFPSGLIHSKQIGLDLDFPVDFYYVKFQDVNDCLLKFTDIRLCPDGCLGLQRNDFAIILQTYYQKTGTRNILNEIQDGMIKLVGAELDHYICERLFWWVKTVGAFSGIPNGYMDVIAGLGYHWIFGPFGLALVPQLGVGAGGGGNVDTGGGILLQPQFGLELPLTNEFSARLSGGYTWAPRGELKAITATGELIYHLDIATGSHTPLNDLPEFFVTRGWRINLFNQTYIHPQRTVNSFVSNINLIAVQIDQFVAPLFFFSYQAAFAYSGDHAGGYASGLIGPGMQTPKLFNEHVQLFTELLIGAGGGGILALNGGSIIEPVVGAHIAITPALGLQASVGQIKALRHHLNTTAINLGLTFSFGTLNR